MRRRRKERFLFKILFIRRKRIPWRWRLPSEWWSTWKDRPDRSAQSECSTICSPCSRVSARAVCPPCAGSPERERDCCSPTPTPTPSTAAAADPPTGRSGSRLCTCKCQFLQVPRSNRIRAIGASWSWANEDSIVYLCHRHHFSMTNTTKELICRLLLLLLLLLLLYSSCLIAAGKSLSVEAVGVLLSLTT